MKARGRKVGGRDGREQRQNSGRVHQSQMNNSTTTVLEQQL